MNFGQYNFDNDLSSYYKFTITNLSLTNSREDGYNDMYVKPYVSKVNHKDLEDMVDCFIKTGKMSKDNSNELIGIGGNIIAKAGIRGDWGMKRYTFNMNVRCESLRSNVVYDLLLCGYTDPTYGFKINNLTPSFDNYDNNLVFHINSCKKMDMDRSGRLISVSDLGVMDDNTVSSSITRTLRPADVVTTIQIKEISDEYGGNNIAVGNPLNSYNTTFNRKHNASNTYMSSIFNSLTENASDMSMNDIKIDSSYRRKTVNLLHGAVTQLSNESLQNLPFMTVLNNSTNSPGFNKFNLLSLRSVVPDLHPATIMCIDVSDAPNGDSYSYIYASKQNTLGFNGLDNYANIVQDIHNMFVNFMLSNYLGGIDVIIHNARGMDEMPMERPRVKFIINNLQSLRPTENAETFMGVINNNLANICRTVDKYLNKTNIEYNIALNMSVSIDSTIMLQVKGQDVYGNIEISEPRLYRFPTFADMNYTSMAGNTDNLELLAKDVENIVYAVQEAL